MLLCAEYAVKKSGRSTCQLLAADFKTTTLGLHAQDTFEIASGWKLIDGLRLDNFKGNYERAGNTAPDNMLLSHPDPLLSKRLSLMPQPNEEVSDHAAHGTLFNTPGSLYQFYPLSTNTLSESSHDMEIGAK